jgi:tetratricopeptide (TPR) repeat protein
MQQTGKPKDAITAYRQILSQKPSDLLASNNLATLMLDTGKDSRAYEEALKIAMPLEKAINPAYRDTLAWAYYKLGKYDQAKPILEGVVKQAAGTFPLFQYHLGMTYFHLGDKSHAKILLQQSLEGGNYPGKEEAKATLGQL